MAIVLENNRHFVGSDITTTEGVPGPEGLGVLARVFIDLGIAVATIGVTVLTAGVASPAMIGLAGSATALVTNTAIDYGEGNTDLLTLGLDIGLPVLTEGLGVLVSSAAESINLSAKNVIKITDKYNLDPITKFERLGNGEGANVIQKSSIKKLVNYNKELIANNGKQLRETGYGVKITDESIKDMENGLKQINSGMRSITDILDKFTGAARDFLAKLLPRLTNVIKQFEEVLKQLKKAMSVLLNPVNLALTKAKTATKAILKNIKADEFDVKMRMQTIKQRYNIRKQSILQNALISRYNITRVESSWVLGTSLVINDADEDGTIINAHLIWWFIPEATKHDGSRGAVPEPMGKRPVGMLNINQAQYDAIMAEASKGTFYLDNVANGKSSSSLFGGPSGINISDLKANFISRLFKNAISIIPGYSLFVDIQSSIKQFQTMTNKIVKGELGSDYVRQLTNYKSHLHSAGSLLLPKQFNEAANAIYSSGTYDGSGILKSVDSRAQSIQSNLNKSGTVMHVKNY